KASSSGCGDCAAEAGASLASSKDSSPSKLMPPLTIRTTPPVSGAPRTSCTTRYRADCSQGRRMTVVRSDRTMIVASLVSAAIVLIVHIFHLMRFVRFVDELLSKPGGSGIITLLVLWLIVWTVITTLIRLVKIRQERSVVGTVRQVVDQLDEDDLPMDLDSHIRHLFRTGNPNLAPYFENLYAKSYVSGRLGLVSARLNDQNRS